MTQTHGRSPMGSASGQRQSQVSGRQFRQPRSGIKQRGPSRLKETMRRINHKSMEHHFLRTGAEANLKK